MSYLNNAFDNEIHEERQEQFPASYGSRKRYEKYRQAEDMHLDAEAKDRETGRMLREVLDCYTGISFESDGNGVSACFSDGEAHGSDLAGCLGVVHQIMTESEGG